MSFESKPQGLSVVTATKFEGIFGIPLKVVMQYPSERGNMIPHALQTIFSKLDSLNGIVLKIIFSLLIFVVSVLTVPNLYLREPNMPEVVRLRKVIDAGK